MPSALLDDPVAVPDKIFGLSLFLDFIDRGHSLCSLYPPLAAVASLPLRYVIYRSFQQTSIKIPGTPSGVPGFS
jgi:hypothetical protein